MDNHRVLPSKKPSGRQGTTLAHDDLGSIVQRPGPSLWWCDAWPLHQWSLLPEHDDANEKHGKNHSFSWKRKIAPSEIHRNSNVLDSFLFGGPNYWWCLKQGGGECPTLSHLYVWSTQKITMQKTSGHVQRKRMVIGTDPKDIYINHKFPSVYWSHHHCCWGWAKSTMVAQSNPHVLGGGEHQF